MLGCPLVSCKVRMCEIADVMNSYGGLPGSRESAGGMEETGYA
jgi:hypothetical protein